MNVKTFTSGVLRTNNYLVWDNISQKGFLVDCSLEAVTQIQDFIQKQSIFLEAIYLTHCHFDHIDGLDSLERKYVEKRIFIHSSEKTFLKDYKENLSYLVETSLEIEHPLNFIFLKEGQEIELADNLWKVWHTPGHSPGSLSLICYKEKTVFSGDVLFQGGGKGKPDFHHGNIEDLLKSIHRLLELPKDFTFYTGHGRSTTVEREISFYKME